MSEEKRYAQLPRSSINLYAESDGYSALPDTVTALLAEDSNYRLRQIIQNASQLMHHSKRKRLTTKDINEALRLAQVEPLYGYGSPEPLPCTFVREADLFVPDDPEVKLCSLPFSNDDLPEVTTQAPSLNVQWLAVEGVMKRDPLATTTTMAGGDSVEGLPGAQLPDSHEGGVVKKSSLVAPVPVVQVPVSESMMSYYDHITQAILGSDQELLLIALEDLQTNDRLTPLLPYLLNFVSVGVKKMGHDLTQLGKLLYTIQALVDNPSLHLATQPYLTLLVQSLLYCVLEPLAASLNPNQDHWTFRHSAASLLTHTLRRWSSSTNQLWWHTGQILRDSLSDFSKPFSSHYGALVAIHAMGMQEVELLMLGKLDGYWAYIQGALEGNALVNPQVKADAHKVRGTLLLLCELLLLWRLKSTFPEAWSQREQETNGPFPIPPANLSSEPFVKQEHSKSRIPKSSLDLYRKLYEMFGDALAMRLPCLPFVEGMPRRSNSNIQPHTLQYTAPPELVQTGEEMLESFYEGVCEEESARSPANSMDEDNSYEENSPMSDEAPAVELQIRSTISDPALGIKLTIAKLRRDLAPPPPKESPSKSSKRKKAARMDPSSVEVFERCVVRPTFRPLLFNFEGGTPIPIEELRRPTLPPVSDVPWRTWKLSTTMKKTGKKRQRSKNVKRNFMASLFLCL